MRLPAGEVAREKPEYRIVYRACARLFSVHNSIFLRTMVSLHMFNGNAYVVNQL